MPRLPAAGSVTAKKTRLPGCVALLMNCFDPLTIYRSPFFTARVRKFDASDPACGSVNPNDPTCSPVANLRNQRSFCASVPEFAITMHVGELCTDTMVETDPSPAAISSSNRAYVTGSISLPSHSAGVVAPNTPSSPSSRMISGSIRPAFSLSAAPGANRSWANFLIMSTMIVSPPTGKLSGIVMLLVLKGPRQFTRMPALVQAPPRSTSLGPCFVARFVLGVRGIEAGERGAFVHLRHDPCFLAFLFGGLGGD